MNNPNGNQLKKEICQALGLKPRDISVRYDGSYRVNIKNPTVPAAAVEQIAKKYENIHYCHASQEILCGGNTFVFVEYDYKILTTEEQRELRTKFVGHIANNYNFENWWSHWTPPTTVDEVAKLFADQTGYSSEFVKSAVGTPSTTDLKRYVEQNGVA